uniref:Synaptopodin 2 n=1 Tax=Cyclopterus lumpus TaxID=8103 RepID=A0A8C2X809_CYCLU
MEPEAEDTDNKDNAVPWSGSEGSGELCDDASDEEHPLDPLPAHILKSDLKATPACLQSQDWQSAGEQPSPPELCASEEEVSYQEEDDIYFSESGESITESPRTKLSPTSLSPHSERPNFEPHARQTSRPHSQSSSSSLGRAADMTLALALTTEQPLGASSRQGPGTVNRRVESSEEGGSSEAPPASLFFGISDKAAEQAEKWNSDSDTDLCRPDRQRARSTRLSHKESQSDRQVKETKSKCKRIARLLTDAPNPQNKGALLFKKRRQRVKKYTLVSYGTGEKKLDSEDQIEEETEVRSAGYAFVATSESDLEEEYSVYQQQHHLSLNWGSGREMEAETKGKGVMMFAQRRQLMDKIVSEHEDLRNKGLPLETLREPEFTEAQNVYDTEEMYVHTDQANYMDANPRPHEEYQESIQQMNHLSNVPRPLVSNRTAKPFLGFSISTTAPVTKKQEPRFRVPVPINTHPQVWSPTGEIIASRDERISVPAIKAGILPEGKRRFTNKQSTIGKTFLGLGAEACNFMQPRTINSRIPLQVAPKPTINPPSQPPVSMQARSPKYSPHHPPSPSRNKLEGTQNSVASCPPQAGKSNGYASKASQASSRGRVSVRGTNQAGDGPTMAGKGAALFAKRQSRMEKFVVDDETVQANKTRSPSPNPSLPNSLRYSSIVRAPPPSSYNPLLAPFYPPSAAKQPPSTSPKIKPKSKEKPKAAPKHLNPLDIMKHQPYQLDSSLFKYEAVPEAKSPSPKPTPASKFEATKSLKHRSAPSHSPYNASELVVQSKAEVPAKSPVLVTFSPASLIARGARQMAPRPKFSAKKPVVTSKQSRSLSLPKRLNSMPSPRLLSPASTPGIQSSFLPTQRKMSFQEKVYKPLSPWEAASRSLIGSVDDAFAFQSLPSSVASNVKAAGHRRSLPEPPDEWKRRVSLDPAPVSMGHYHAAPAFQAPFMSRTFSPERPTFYGPPFRPAQPLRPVSRASIGYMGQGSSPTMYSPVPSAVQKS